MDAFILFVITQQQVKNQFALLSWYITSVSITLCCKIISTVVAKTVAYFVLYYSLILVKDRGFVLLNNCQAPGPVPGPGQGPGQGPEPSHTQYSTFIIRKSKGRTWSDTIIKQTTPPPLNFFKLTNERFHLSIRSETLKEGPGVTLLSNRPPHPTTRQLFQADKW